MQLIDRNSILWETLQPEIKDLITEGESLIDYVESNKNPNGFSDYSFLVFSFSKAYEGFLKKLFLDLKIIKRDEYYGDEIRIGRILNPHFQKEIGNAFTKICNHTPGGINIAQKLWDVWKIGRNLVFHYFPHNFRRLNYDEARDVIAQIVGAMELAVLSCKVDRRKDKTTAIWK